MQRPPRKKKLYQKAKNQHIQQTFKKSSTLSPISLFVATSKGFNSFPNQSHIIMCSFRKSLLSHTQKNSSISFQIYVPDIARTWVLFVWLLDQIKPKTKHQTTGEKNATPELWTKTESATNCIVHSPRTKDTGIVGSFRISARFKCGMHDNSKIFRGLNFYFFFQRCRRWCYLVIFLVFTLEESFSVSFLSCAFFPDTR